MIAKWAVMALLIWPGVLAKIPHFLFAGQSNMEGVLDDLSRFETLLKILHSSQDFDFLYTRLIVHLEEGNSSPSTPIDAYKREAGELIRLKNEGLLGSNFLDPVSSVRCSFYQLFGDVDYRYFSFQPNELAVDQDLSPFARCGMPFGPELMFGHVMDECAENSLISLVKFAAGGTEIDKHWSKSNGSFWGKLVEQIQDIDPTQEEWKGIVWYQGENDAFDQWNVDSYEDNLATFIANVRQEIHNVDPNIFGRPSDIPVVIVGMGCWITKSNDVWLGPNLAQAQADFVANDGNAVLVTTDDLSCHYHLDDASQLIIGYRVAEAMRTFSSVPCGLNPPTDSPVVPPTDAPIAPTDSPIVPPTDAPITPSSDCYSEADILICHASTNCCSGVGNCSDERPNRRRCLPVGGPPFQPARCISSQDCTDGNVCTTNMCNAGACSFTPIVGCGPCVQNWGKCRFDSQCCSGNCNSRRGRCRGD